MTDITFYTTPRFLMTRSTSSRRLLFVDGDWLKFYQTSVRNQVKLVVYDAGDLANEVLPSHILLDFNPATGKLEALNQYGRKKITFKPHGTLTNWIAYEGEFVNGTVHQPDEGGDGDPK